MELNSFNNLSLPDRASLIGEYGKLLTSMEYYGVRVYLFSLNSSLVEIFENVETRQITEITIATYDALDKYLSRILIGNLKTRLR